MAWKTLLVVIVATLVGLWLIPAHFALIAIVGLLVSLIIIWGILAGNQNRLNEAKWARFNESKTPLGTAYVKYEGL